MGGTTSESEEEMDVGNILIGLGVFTLGFALIGWAYNNPALHARIVQLFTPGQTTDVAQISSAQRQASDKLSVDEQVLDLRAGEFVTFTDTPGNVGQELQVTATGALQALNRAGREFTPREGERYQLIALESELLLMSRPDGWVYLNTHTVLIGEDARQFDGWGEAFSAKGQSPRSVSFTYRNKRWAILDVGYLRYDHVGGKSHLADREMIKYLIAEGEGGSVLYLENKKTGQDRVWFGRLLGPRLNDYVDRVLRAAA